MPILSSFATGFQKCLFSCNAFRNARKKEKDVKKKRMLRKNVERNQECEIIDITNFLTSYSGKNKYIALNIGTLVARKQLQMIQ